MEYESGKRDKVVGEMVDYAFDEPGDHVVTLTVMDAAGNEATSGHFTVHVPNVLLWLFTILGIVIIALVSLFLLKKKILKTNDI